MADEKGMATREQAQEVNILKRAALGEISWFSKEVLKPVAMAAGAGAVGVVSGRFMANKYFPNSVDGEADENAKTKRGAAKIALGLGGAGMLRKLSPAAAMGWGVGLAVDGVADLIEDTVDDQLHDWFDSEGEDSRTPGPEVETSETSTGSVYPSRRNGVQWRKVG